MVHPQRSIIALCAGRGVACGKILGACWKRTSHIHADDRLHAREGTPLGSGRKRGEQKQAIGRSRGGRNTKIHALADAKGRLLAILLTGGQAHDCPVAERLIRRVKPSKAQVRHPADRRELHRPCVCRRRRVDSRARASARAGVQGAAVIRFLLRDLTDRTKKPQHYQTTRPSS